MENKHTGHIHTLESFGLVDGPGVRFVVFLKGCRMRCQYCHNPDTWSGEGKLMSAEDLYRHVRRYQPYWKNNGGITVSGGEPLLQTDFLIEFFTLAKADHIHTAIDTAGEPFSDDSAFLEKFDRLLNVTDLFLLDLKVMDETSHKKLTGVGNQNILQMARYLSEHHKKMWIRHVLVPNLTDDEYDLRKMHEFISTLKGVERVEVLPYHTLGMIKWKELSLDYPLQGVLPPTEEQIKRAEALLHIHNN